MDTTEKTDLVAAIDKLSDDTIASLARGRGLMAKTGELDAAFADGLEEGYDDGRESAITAIAQIRAGKTEEAVVTLERAFLPAWTDQAACEARYREVMGRV